MCRYVTEVIEPHKTLLVKSGCDFRDLTTIQVELPPAGGATGSSRPTFSWQRHTITAQVPEEPAMAAIVRQFEEQVNAKMQDVLCYSATDIDGRFSILRSAESSAANLILDVFRLEAGADIAFLVRSPMPLLPSTARSRQAQTMPLLTRVCAVCVCCACRVFWLLPLQNGGSIRSDMIHPAGAIKVKDLCALLPMLDPTVVISITGAQLLRALENGVGAYPAKEGRFSQVSGMRYAFDPRQVAGQRVLADQVTVGGQPLELEKHYKLCTTAYIGVGGKDGYTVFPECPVLVDDEECITMPTAVRNHFAKLRVLNAMAAVQTVDDAQGALKAATDAKPALLGAEISAKWKAAASKALALRADGASFNGVEETGICVKHPEYGMYLIAPVVEGRIRNVAEE